MGALGHAGLPGDPETDEIRQSQGLPVYRPTDPAMIDQTPYRDYVARCAVDHRERIEGT
jgi:hypothetical protein